MKKIAVYLPDDFLTIVEAVAEQHFRPTSVFIRQVLVDYINEKNNQKNAVREEPEQWVAISNKLAKRIPLVP